jgi:hypothetical protein
MSEVLLENEKYICWFMHRLGTARISRLHPRAEPRRFQGAVRNFLRILS